MKHRWFYILSGVILLLLVGGITLISFIKAHINERIQHLEGFTVEHNADELEVSLFARSLSLHDVLIAKTLADGSGMALNISVGSVHLEGVHIADWWLNKKLHISDLILNDPVISCQITSDTNLAVSSEERSRSLSLQIDNLHVRNGKGIIDNTGTKMHLGIDRIDLQVEQLEKMESKWSIGGLAFTLGDIDFISADSIHQITIARIEHAEQHVSIHDFRITPTREKQVLARALKHRNVMTTMYIPVIECTNLNLRDLTLARSFNIGQVQVDSMKATFYIDKGIPVDPSKYVMLPQEQLQRLRQVLTVDTVTLAHAQLRYEEFEPGKGQVGHIFFDDLNTTITNITNDSARIHKNGVMRINATALFQGAGALHAKFEFDLTDPGYQYSYTSTLGPMKIAKANTILIPIADLLVESGMNNGVELSIQANNFTSLGKLSFDYEELKVRPLNSEHSGLLTALVNKILVNSNNTRKKGKFKEGEVNSERDTTRSITHQIWKAIQSGLATTVLPNILLKKDVNVKDKRN